ncbi:MAG TPA: divalent-cation tolerance protein CutA [Casimicrobiaceae bacterium]|nr:divalent-cation tolerance protein CutA [Casimicrobiaceae bacterium]
MPDAAILVLTSLPDHDTALALARALVTGRLAACVNVGAPVESMYHWRGQIETAREVPVAIKTRRELYPQVEAAIVAIHPYELPEVVAVPVTHGLHRYLDWIAAETAAP